VLLGAAIRPADGRALGVDAMNIDADAGERIVDNGALEPTLSFVDSRTLNVGACDLD